MVAPLVAAGVTLGLNALKGLWNYKEQKEEYKLQKEVAEYNNELNRREYILNSNIVNYNEVSAEEDYITQVLANDKDALVSQGTIAVAQTVAERGGNSAKLVSDSVQASFNSQEMGLTKTYEQKMQDIIFDRAKLELNYIGGQTWLPKKPSMFNTLLSSFIGGIGSSYASYIAAGGDYKDKGEDKSKSKGKGGK